MKDIVIAACDLYNWNNVKNWAKSLIGSGFSGDKYVFTYRVDENIKLELKKMNFIVLDINYDNFIQPINYNLGGLKTQVHRMRLFHAWQLLNEIDLNEINHVIFTDIKDVIFQRNPSEWLENNLKNEILAPSESCFYNNEIWNANSILNSYGQIIYKYVIEDKVTYNSGTIAGKSKTFKDLLLMSYLIANPIVSGCDQPSFNLLINTTFKDKTHFCGMQEGWCAQVGSTISEEKSQEILVNEAYPIIKDGYAYTEKNQLFYLLHQYDRIKELNNIINKRYE